MEIKQLLRGMIEREASDLHLKAGHAPVLRIHGQLVPQADWPIPDEAALREVLETLTNEAQREAFARDLELDFAYELGREARFRVNVACQRGGLYLALRAIRCEVPTLAELNLPQVCARLAMLPRGLVLVTGPAGCGKSTTLAAMIEHMNRTAARRVITIEDPIEYVFQDRRSVITQREVGVDTRTFAAALKHALRQDPDVIMVGEMRDLETIAATLTAAETGHLVLATLHTPSAPEAVDRIVDVFPSHQQVQVRTQLAMTLAGVIAQRLIPRADGSGRVAACEVMTGTPAVRNLIREAKTPQMVSAMQTGREHGMQTLDQALRDLYRSQQITLDAALANASNVKNFKRLLSG
ncbi:MAG TPA: type IV pilus twitching motility protein PilT [Chloroflexi bacterium]|nr:type IV pilus twitching motility protein PilT [Chloroflexota bacterium]